MTFRLSSRFTTFACGLAALASLTQASEIIYDTSPLANPRASGVLFAHDRGEMSSTDERPGGYEWQSQYAQYIHLGGTNRHVTQIEAWYLRWDFVMSESRDISFDATLRIYAAIPNGNDVLPGALLWEGTNLGVELPTSVFRVPQRRSFAIDVVLPDAVFLSLSHSNFDFHGASAAPIFGNYARVDPPIVGTGDREYFEQLTATGEWRRDPEGAIPMDLSVRIGAENVPTGSSLLVLGGAGVGMVARRRRG